MKIKIENDFEQFGRFGIRKRKGKQGTFDIMINHEDLGRIAIITGNEAKDIKDWLDVQLKRKRKRLRL